MNVEENIECKFLISKAEALQLWRRRRSLRRAKGSLAIKRTQAEPTPSKSNGKSDEILVFRNYLT